MHEYVYKFLRTLGLSDKEIDAIEDFSNAICYVSLEHAIGSIERLKSLGLSAEEIKDLLIHDKYFLCMPFESIDNYNHIYKDILGLKQAEIKQLVLSYHGYSRYKLSDKVAYLEGCGYSNDDIKELFMSSPEKLGLRLSEFKEYVSNIQPT